MLIPCIHEIRPGLFNEGITKADDCIRGEGANPYPNLYGIKAPAYDRMNDSVNAKASYEEYFKRQSEDKIGPGLCQICHVTAEIPRK